MSKNNYKPIKTSEKQNKKDNSVKSSHPAKEKLTGLKQSQKAEKLKPRTGNNKSAHEQALISSKKSEKHSIFPINEYGKLSNLTLTCKQDESWPSFPEIDWNKIHLDSQNCLENNSLPDSSLCSEQWSTISQGSALGFNPTSEFHLDKNEEKSCRDSICPPHSSSKTEVAIRKSCFKENCPLRTEEYLEELKRDYEKIQKEIQQFYEREAKEVLKTYRNLDKSMHFGKSSSDRLSSKTSKGIHKHLCMFFEKIEPNDTISVQTKKLFGVLNFSMAENQKDVKPLEIELVGVCVHKSTSVTDFKNTSKLSNATENEEVKVLYMKRKSQYKHRTKKHSKHYKKLC